MILQQLIYSYSICVRKEAGYCCIQYSPCSDTGSWTINQIKAAGSLETETTNCAADYVTINGAAAACPNTTPQVIQPINQVCGGIFSGVDTSTVAGTVCGMHNLTFFIKNIYINLCYKWIFIDIRL